MSDFLREMNAMHRSFAIGQPVYDWDLDSRLSRSVPVISVPALEVPPRKTAPVAKPESASVTVLRGVLADRRAERKRVDDARASRLLQAEEAERRAVMLRERAADDTRHIEAADAAIAALLADIETLGGKPE